VLLVLSEPHKKCDCDMNLRSDI